MAKKQISPSEASCAFRTFEWLFFSMRPFMAFEMLQTRKGAPASRTNVRPWLVGFGRWEIRAAIRSSVQRLCMRSTCFGIIQRPCFNAHLFAQRALHMCEAKGAAGVKAMLTIARCIADCNSARMPSNVSTNIRRSLHS